MKRSLLFAAALLGCTLLNAQNVKLKGVYQNNRFDDHADHNYSTYVGWNYALNRAISIVSQGIYAMDYDGNSPTAPYKEPAVELSDFHSGEINKYGGVVGGEYTDNDKALWANNFNLMVGNSGAVYVNGQIVTVMSRDEQSTTDEELFAVRKWDAKTGNLLSSETFPKSANLESAGMAYNPKDGKVYGLFYITGLPLPTEITEDPDYFEDEDDDMTDGDAGYAICTIDLKTMQVTRITPGVYYDNFITFAINSEGRAFALTSGGSSAVPEADGKVRDINGKQTGAQLYEFDLKTGRKVLVPIEAIDENGEVYTDYVSSFSQGTGYCSQYKRQAACFSKSNPNKMYWVGYFNSGKGINAWGSWSDLSDKDWKTNGKYDTCLYEVDITTGDATRLSMIENRYTFSALWVDGDDNSDDSDINVEKPEVDVDNDSFIILSTADNGGIWQQVESGKAYTYYLEPAVGWKIHSVTFNNQDVTADVTEKGFYTTPEVSSRLNTLFVAFEEDKEDTGVQAVKQAGSEVKLLGIAGGIRVVGAQAGDKLEVYGVDGRMVSSQTLSGRQTDIALDSKALYIVKVANKVIKIRL
ncbi:MAG: hypothetical protein IJ144_02740 [Prevotella sp.]|nr:hypothetical protein [Prevotella sp.]